VISSQTGLTNRLHETIDLLGYMGDESVFELAKVGCGSNSARGTHFPYDSSFCGQISAGPAVNEPGNSSQVASRALAENSQAISSCPMFESALIFLSKIASIQTLLALSPVPSIFLGISALADRAPASFATCTSIQQFSIGDVNQAQKQLMFDFEQLSSFFFGLL